MTSEFPKIEQNGLSVAHGFSATQTSSFGEECQSAFAAVCNRPKHTLPLSHLPASYALAVYESTYDAVRMSATKFADEYQRRLILKNLCYQKQVSQMAPLYNPFTQSNIIWYRARFRQFSRNSSFEGLISFKKFNISNLENTLNSKSTNLTSCQNESSG